MYLVNGVASTTIDVADRGFQYGDGLFETIEIDHRQAIFLEWHLQRLQKDCQRLLLPSLDSQLIVSEIASICSSAPEAGKAILKLIITRGAGGRGYQQPLPLRTSRVLSLHPFPNYPDCYQQHGIVARVCQTPSSINPALAGMKHLNRLEQVLARAEWKDTDIQEGIMLNADGHVIEGTMSNIFYYKNNCLYTAVLDRSGVAGVMRQIIIELWAQHGCPVTEHNYTLTDLFSAEEIFLSNAIIGIWPVRQIEHHAFPVGQITRQIQAWLMQYKAKSVGVEP
jgi:4-amino-4-deoxychorismate lyase